MVLGKSHRWFCDFFNQIILSAVLHVVPANLFVRRNVEFHCGPRTCLQLYTLSRVKTQHLCLVVLCFHRVSHLPFPGESKLQYNNKIKSTLPLSPSKCINHSKILQREHQEARSWSILACICIPSLLKEPASKHLIAGTGA